MASPAFQIAYTDGLALMLLIASIWFLRKQRYLLAAAAVWGLALARPIAAPLLVVIAVHALVYHRRARPNAYRTRSLVLLAGSTVVATAAWPLLAAVVTKTPDAYTSAQSAWRLDDEVGPFGAFSVGYRLGGWPAVAVLVLLAAGLIGVASSKRAVAWGPELRAWAAAYPVYILSVVPVATSMFRFALLALPLLWVWPNALPNRLRWPCALALASLGLVTQWYWVRHFLVLGPIDLQVGMP
jgi:hypothetical protein